MNASEYNRAVGWIQFVRTLLPIIGITWLLTACVAPNKYTPASTYTTPDRSEPSVTKSIPITVRMVKLIDVSAAEDKEDGWLYGSGWSVTSAERLNGDLAVLVTDAIAKDFQSHGVFQTLAQGQPQEQLRLGGKIHKFYQRREQYLWALCCGLLGVLMPFPLLKEEGEVELELTLFRTDDSPVKSYTGKSSFLKRCNFYGSRCWESYNMSPAKYLDQALADSLLQIRKAIAEDKDIITHQVSGQALRMP